MKKIYKLLKIIMWCILGLFAGSSVYKYYDYKTHPDLYAMWSAPWYLSIEIHAVFTAILVAVILIILWIIRRKMK